MGLDKVCCTGLLVLGLLGTNCGIAARAAPPSASAYGMLDTAQPHAKPAWPGNGIAQRRFPGGNVMFVENDHGKLSAWVLSTYTRSMQIDKDHAHAEALNFFTGRVMKVKVILTEDGHESQAFIDSEGRVHVYALDPGFRFSGTEMDIALPGIKFYGGRASLTGSIGDCDANLSATMPETDYVTGEKPAATWVKYPIYHESPGAYGCLSGDIDSLITSAVDLGDGTILADEGCFVFRLRKADLSPVGAAPALTVVDAGTLNAAIAKAKDQHVEDATGYLINALRLPTGSDVSCKDD